MNKKNLLGAILQFQQEPAFSQLYEEYRVYMYGKYQSCPKKTDILSWEEFRGKKISEVVNNGTARKATT